MKQARIIPRSIERPDGSIAEWFEFDTLHGDHAHRDSDHPARTRAEMEAYLAANGYEVVD
jgi:hypothetical protein